MSRCCWRTPVSAVLTRAPSNSDMRKALTCSSRCSLSRIDRLLAPHPPSPPHSYAGRRTEAAAAPAEDGLQAGRTGPRQGPRTAAAPHLGAAGFAWRGLLRCCVTRSASRAASGCERRTQTPLESTTSPVCPLQARPVRLVLQCSLPMAERSAHTGLIWRI